MNEAMPSEAPTKLIIAAATPHPPEAGTG